MAKSLKPFWTFLIEGGPVIRTEKRGNRYFIQLFDGKESEEIIWQDIQLYPFWVSAASRSKTFKELKKVTPELAEDRFLEVVREFANADVAGDIPEVQTNSNEVKVNASSRETADTLNLVLQGESLQERIEREVKETLGEKSTGVGYFFTENGSYRVELFARKGLLLTLSRRLEKEEWVPEIEGKEIFELLFYKSGEGLAEVLEDKLAQENIPKFAAAYVQALCQAIIKGAIKDVVGEFVEVDGVPLAVYFDVSKNPPKQIDNLTHVLKESERVPWGLPSIPELKSDPELWNDVKTFVRWYLFIEEGDAYDVYVAKVYWSYHIGQIYWFTPYFAYIGPYKSGKTRAQEVDESLCYRPLRVSHVTEADIFRITELFRPTWIIDEQDLNTPGVLSLLNAGQRGGLWSPG